MQNAASNGLNKAAKRKLHGKYELKPKRKNEKTGNCFGEKKGWNKNNKKACV